MIQTAMIFIVLGIAIKYGKMHFLMAGYNTMSKEDKAKYDIEGISSVFRNVMFGMALIMILGFGFSYLTENAQIEKYAFYTALVLGIPYLLIKSNSKEFKKPK